MDTMQTDFKKKMGNVIMDEIKCLLESDPDERFEKIIDYFLEIVQQLSPHSYYLIAQLDWMSERSKNK